MAVAVAASAAAAKLLLLRRFAGEVEETAVWVGCWGPALGWCSWRVLVPWGVSASGVAGPGLSQSCLYMWPCVRAHGVFVVVALTALLADAREMPLSDG